ncbi:hypothetical protein ACVWW4_004218 [Bradyrhizobium sp. LB7.1]
MNSRRRTRCRKPEKKSERLFGVEINPLAVATIHRLPQHTMESIRPIPGAVSPRVAVRTLSCPPSEHKTQDQCACDRAMVRVRSPPGLNNARTSSRLGLERSPGFSATRGSGTSLTFVSDRHLDLFQGICLVQSHDRIPCGSPMIMMRSKSMMNGEQAGRRTMIRSTAQRATTAEVAQRADEDCRGN